MKNNLIDLYREYVRCADMCEAYNKEHLTEIKPYECVRYNGETINYEPSFGFYKAKYSFAVAILEGKPVYVGDTVYDKLLSHPMTVEDVDTLIYESLELKGVDWDRMSWEPPKKPRTFTLNGVELPRPSKKWHDNKVSLFVRHDLMPQGAEQYYHFDSAGSASNFYNRLSKILAEARDKD